jgi:hypothetical protein
MEKTAGLSVAESVKYRIFNLLNKLKRSSYMERIHVNVHIYWGEQSMPRISFENQQSTPDFFTTADQETERTPSSSDALQIIDVTDKEGEIHRQSLTGNDYEAIVQIGKLTPTASETAISPPSLQESEEVRDYWANPRFGLSRVESASQFERMNLEESLRKKKQNNGSFHSFFHRFRKNP